MLSPLLTTKLIRPPLRARHIERPRLRERLNAAQRNRLTLVCAPPGYGKTTLIAGWLAAREQAPQQALTAAWLALDAGDNDPVGFWVYVIAALRQAGLEVGEQARAALQSPQTPPLPPVLTLLINELALQPQPVMLILDDYHEITAPAIHESVTFFCENLPPHVHLLVSCRVDPPLPVARLRVRGQLNEIRAADLQFTPAEAAAFLRDVMGLNLPAADVAALEQRTEGWIAGLQLAALSLAGLSDPAAAVAAFSGSHRHLVDYLTEEVLARQPAAIQNFLLRTAFLDRFCAPLCEAVLDEEAYTVADLQARLEDLEQRNLFVIALDDERRWYRYHHLFADLLRFRARLALNVQERQSARQRAALWFEGAHLWREAIEHALAAGAHELAARIVAGEATATVLGGELTTVGEWLELLPREQIDADPRLGLAQAWVWLFTGQADAAQARLEQVLAAADRQGEEPASWLGEALALRASLDFADENMERAIADSEEALTLLSDRYLPLRSLVTWHLAFIYRSLGQTEQSMRVYRDAVELSDRAGNVLINLSARREMATLIMARGEPHTAQALLTALLEQARAQNLTHLMPVAGAHVHLAELAYEQNLLDEAIKQLKAALRLPQVVAMNFDAYANALLAQTYAALGEHAAAAEAVTRAQQLVVQATHPQRRALTLARIADFWLWQGDAARAAAWLPDGHGVPVDLRHEVHFRQQLTHARYLLATQREQEARALLEQMLPFAAAAGRLTDGVQVRLLLLQALPRPRAGTLLCEALHLAEPAGYVRSFVDAGAAVGTLLNRLQGSEDAPQIYLRQLLAAFKLADEVPANQLLVEPLSPRELEVLRLLAEGYSNREIAERLVFTIATAKKHAEHIYGKLGVRNRVEAVTRARELGLL